MAWRKREPAGKPGKPGKDRWDKIDILLKPVGSLVAGLVIAGIGYWSTQTLQHQQAEETRRQQQMQMEETNRRLYTQIMSSREQGDTDLRKEMFNAIIGAFLTPDETTLVEKALALELLAYNFHDVIDLSPLFKHIAKAVEQSADFDTQAKEALTAQLRRVAREVTEKQLAALAEAGAVTDMNVHFPVIDEQHIEPLSEACYPLHASDPDDTRQRYIYLEARDYDTTTQEVGVHLESGVLQCDPPDPDAVREADTDLNFTVGFFDFPMIDNTRVSNGQRIAVALTGWDERAARLTLVYFPGSRASLKEKPYYEDLIDQLRKGTARLQQAEDAGDQDAP